MLNRLISFHYITFQLGWKMFLPLKNKNMPLNLKEKD